ncbi:hypothetical protein ABID12_002624 [Martelella mangrovi]|uniref:Uncharacterized protein n=1 Tax=Martelella mangrovi TaxID=1397477 RepID=A0ABV2ID02_9HYPH
MNKVQVPVSIEGDGPMWSIHDRDDEPIAILFSLDVAQELCDLINKTKRKTQIDGAITALPPR